MAARKKTYKAGTFKVKTDTYGVVKTKAKLRRSGTVIPKTEKAAPLPESCHFTRAAAKKAADVLRVKKIKSRVVTSGQFFCVYSVGKCRKGELVGTGRAKTTRTRKKKSA